MKDRAQQLLAEQKAIQLATTANGQPWVCTVYFVADGDLNIYWLSLPERRHSKELTQNPNAAITTVVKQDLPVIGLGAEGEVSMVKDEVVVKAVMDLYIKKYGSGEAFYEKFIAGENLHHMYKFTPKKYILFDEVNFSKDESIDFVP